MVRRRNPRPINSCVECRNRKSRCSKTHPCQNCTAFGRECVFITVPESAARKRQRESQSSKSNADWTQPLPVRTQTTQQPEPSNAAVSTTTPGTPPRDYEWEAYQQDVDIDDDAWEKLPAEPEDLHDDVYEDENEDEDQIATDLTIRIGRMIICENITGFFRPQYAEEVLPFSLANNSSIVENVSLFLFGIFTEISRASLASSSPSIPSQLLRSRVREHLSPLGSCLQRISPPYRLL